MICKCGASGVLNQVLNEEFYYCRSCKIEIQLEIVDVNQILDWDLTDIVLDDNV